MCHSWAAWSFGRRGCSYFAGVSTYSTRTYKGSNLCRAKIETADENGFNSHLSDARVGLIDDENEGRKSCDTLSLTSSGGLEVRERGQ